MPPTRSAFSRLRLIRSLLALPLLCTAIALCPAVVDAAESSSSLSASSQSVSDAAVVHGSFSSKYVFRKTRVDDDIFRDEDLSSDLRLDITKPLTNAYEFHFYGTLKNDFSKHRNSKDFSPFEDIGDTYHSENHGYLYEAHLDLNEPISRVSQIRIGRQDGTRDEPVFFDGVATDIRVANGVNVTAYGGAAVHLYELNNKWGDDSLQGAGLDLRPATSTVISMDFLHTDDKRTMADTTSRHDQLASFKLVQRFSPNFRTTTKVRYENGDPRDASLRIIAAAPDLGLELNASYLRQFRVQNELSNELSPYYDVIGQSDPYQRTDAKLRKLFGSRAAIDIGYFQRTLIHPQQEGAFNRAYTRSYAVLAFSDLFVNGFSLSLTGEQWKSRERHVNASGFDAGYAFKKGRRSPKMNIGSYFSLYKYDYYLSLGERTRVRTNYVKLDYPFATRYALSCAYEFERGLQEYQTAKLGIRYEF